MIALVIVVVAVVSIASISYLGQQVAAKYNGTLTLVSDSGYPGKLQLWFHTSNMLYNCKLTITYVATNGSRVVISQNIGTVDSNSQPTEHRIWLTDYPMNGTIVKDFTEADHLDNLEIKAYGYVTSFVG